MSAIGSAMVSNSLPLPESAGSSHPSGRPNLNQSAAKVAQDFESVFASMLLKEMRQSLEPGSMFGEDSGDVYGGLFDRYFGEQMTKGSGLGMASMVQENIERMQNAGKPVAAPVSDIHL
jgi:flagellar protein FlgJ